MRRTVNKRIPTRVRIVNAAFGADGKPTLFRGIVMSGAAIVASTRNVRNQHVCACLAAALQASYDTAQRAK